MFTKLGRDEVLMVPHLCLGFRQTPPRGGSRAGQKYVNGGSLLQRTSSSAWKATAINPMYGSDLKAYGKKRCYFWFHSEVKYLTVFYVFLDLVILVYFNAISSAHCTQESDQCPLGLLFLAEELFVIHI